MTKKEIQRRQNGNDEIERLKQCLLDAAAELETFCKHSKRLRPYDNVTTAQQTAARCRFLAAQRARTLCCAPRSSA